MLKNSKLLGVWLCDWSLFGLPKNFLVVNVWNSLNPALVGLHWTIHAYCVLQNDIADRLHVSRRERHVGWHVLLKALFPAFPPLKQCGSEVSESLKRIEVGS